MLCLLLGSARARGFELSSRRISCGIACNAAWHEKPVLQRSAVLITAADATSSSDGTADASASAAACML